MVYFRDTMSKAERTRQFIIERAAPIINRKGMAGTSISDIMEATQLAKGCLYGNFVNKDEICLEAFNYLTTQYTNEREAFLKKYPSAKEKLFAYLEHFKEGKFREEYGGCPVLNFGTESDDTKPEIKKRVHQVILTSQKYLEDLLAQGINDGEFHSELNAKRVALKFYAMLEGIVLISRVGNDDKQVNEIIISIKEEIELFSV
ncbi:TetR/AcrR family transcriptional regulator [Maribellus maritimus]|uniref:TetR/AcrR family transcriptional regulator n=1 Tax=Maribellus maritimus TaxID=2870838 RepID=UPI001EEA0057|nr:TetR family transcriptional regulator C-terminal domain-containing protein [Maribellus maritimus]MCG6190374.1 TetR family transcriptional regulator C-terminal domain-containing protein [Maribellus maritimus]